MLISWLKGVFLFDDLTLVDDAIRAQQNLWRDHNSVRLREQATPNCSSARRFIDATVAHPHGCVYYLSSVHIGAVVRTNIDIDDKLLLAAMRASGCKTKRATVEEGLRLLARRKAYEAIRALRGKVHWEGDPDAMRRHKAR